jgi:hypothetical protein
MAEENGNNENARKTKDWSEIDPEEKELLDSWKEAMAHRWDGIWEWGEKLKRLKFTVDSWLIILLIFLVFVGLTWMVKPFIP